LRWYCHSFPPPSGVVLSHFRSRVRRRSPPASLRGDVVGRAASGSGFPSFFGRTVVTPRHLPLVRQHRRQFCGRVVRVRLVSGQSRRIWHLSCRIWQCATHDGSLVLRLAVERGGSACYRGEGWAPVRRGNPGGQGCSFWQADRGAPLG
jgi:hypothetical protein